MRRGDTAASGLGEEGFALPLVLLLVLVLGAGAAAAVPRAVAWHRAALVQHETDCLVSDLHLMQQMARTSSGLAEAPGVETPSDAGRLEFELRGWDHAYLIFRRAYADGSRLDGLLLRHTYPEGVVISTNVRGRIWYGKNGGTSTPATLFVHWKGDEKDGKRVILDSVGRIRVEEINENADEW